MLAWKRRLMRSQSGLIMVVALMAVALSVAGCAETDGGQSGGGTNVETPVCKETSRQMIAADDVAEGFTVAPAQELLLYAQSFSGQVLDDAEEVVASYLLVLSLAEASELEVVRQEKNDSAGGPEPALAGLDTVAFECEDFYELPMEYTFRLGEEQTPLVDVSGTVRFRVGASRSLSAFAKKALDDLQGSFEPALVAEGYDDIELHFTWSNVINEVGGDPEELKGQMAWQGQKVNGDPNDPNTTAEAKSEVTGSFSSEL